MYKPTGRGLLFLIIVSITGCAAMVTVPDSHEMVSNYRNNFDSGQQKPCQFNLASNDSEFNDVNALDPGSIRLLNWNVYKGVREGWIKDFAQLSRYSDIVALQEAQLHEIFQSGLVNSNLHWDLTTAFRFNDAATGVLLASSVKPVAICALHAEEPIINIPKSAMVTEYRIKGTGHTLMVSNIHMINFSFGTEEYKKQITQLKNILIKHKGPMIVTGDFNTWNDQRMSILAEIAVELGLSAVKYADDYRMTFFGNPLDHVYYRGLTAMESSTQQVESSDHNPMIVTFKL